jgi:hypothetical protein
VSLLYYAGDNTEFVTALSTGRSYVDTINVFGVFTHVINVFGVFTHVIKITAQSIGGASAGAGVRVELFDSLLPSCEDDGWNGVNLYFTPDKSSSVTLPSGSLGTITISLTPDTYSPFAFDGLWQQEVG